MPDTAVVQKWNNTIDLPGMLLDLGEDLEREGLKDTPRRMHNAWREQLIGYTLYPEEILKRQFEVEEFAKEQIVVCKNIAFTSTCEHHLLPFIGHITIAYIPNRQIVGLSKLPRLVECFARRLQIQERLVVQIAKSIMSEVKPLGVFVVAKAVHLCCKGRGVTQYPMEMVTAQHYGKIDSARLKLVLDIDSISGVTR